MRIYAFGLLYTGILVTPTRIQMTLELSCEKIGSLFQGLELPKPSHLKRSQWPICVEGNPEFPDRMKAGQCLLAQAPKVQQQRHRLHWCGFIHQKGALGFGFQGLV